MSPEQESQEAMREEAERLYAMNPSWHMKEAETKLSSHQPPAPKLDLRKRAGKRILDERRLALKPCLRCSRAAGYCWVGINGKNCAFCTEQGVKCTLKTKKHTVVDENYSVVSVLRHHPDIHGNGLTFSQTQKAHASSSSKISLGACK